MKTRWHNLQERLRATLWLPPAILAAGAAAAAELSLRFDAWIAARGIDPPFLYPGGVSAARDVLGTLAGSMISLTTISFSVMMVVLTLASNQFGPRVLRNFTADRFYQVVLGVFVATFAFCLLVLGRLPGDAFAEGPPPRFTVTLALALAFGSLATLIAFIHHVARSIQASQIVLRAHHEACRSIDALYPGNLGNEVKAPGRSAADFAAAEPRCTITADRAGYVQTLSIDELMDFAREHDAVVELLIKPGHFISTGRPLMRLHGNAALAVEKLADKLRPCVILGAERTGEQDAQYGIRQLMEIAIRSLSPGINDPVTAVACIDYIGENLLTLARRDLPGRERCDDEGKLRVIVSRDDFAEIAAAAFDNLRHYGRGHPEVMGQLSAILRHLAPELQRPSDRRWFDRTVAELRDEAEYLPGAGDRRRFEHKCERIQAGPAR